MLELLQSRWLCLKLIENALSSEIGSVAVSRVQMLDNAMENVPMGKPHKILLVGCGRSGTTLLAAMLNAHPKINIPRAEALYSIYGPYVKVPTGSDPMSDRQWHRLKRLFISDVAIQAWEHPPSLSDLDVDSPHKTFASAYRLLHQQQARKSGKTISVIDCYYESIQN